MLLVTAVLLSLMFAGAWIAWGFFGIEMANWATGERSIDKAGQWGDSFGAFNALISSLGFCAVALTLWSQSKTLQHQQIALDLQQQEIKQQQAGEHIQRFETTFFELLKQLTDIRSRVKVDGNYIGPEAWGYVARQLQTAAEKYNLKDSNNEEVSRLAFLECKIISKKYYDIFGPYLRVLRYFLIKIDDDIFLSDAEKSDFVYLLRATQNTSEYVIFGMIGADSSDRFKELIVKYGLIKYMPMGPLRDLLVRMYPPNTFRESD
ncbi:MULTISPECIES: putative phage abortive infection protein [unclassified Bosea (in: a-proteobacteria)]|uniref:putative phage abortive infection protein n=1 Tax=unclassified Bosea (in: a-proteobacteria) TaxID=2653178 RepID=UPI000F75DAEC|nr:MULTISPECIES: putative phage abortive infection protein [unclassified Bosea (in: a-proteobacteria)]AZO77488.1 hypothetical protein BLM15_07580 [Bosea sp. Tri-49]RXT18093.1 hypothetical protein B5U98_22730 [Bosea sp. Tri-39]RXT32691.1 hypothetical protein B5U99_29075 [Bosea sp. Tri-54]